MGAKVKTGLKIVNAVRAKANDKFFQWFLNLLLFLFLCFALLIGLINFFIVTD